MNAKFVIAAVHPGTVWLNLVSLFPPTWAGRANGNRVDLMEKLRALRPGFLRFPGGDYLEGETVETRFNWKDTIGALAERPTHPSPWGYQSSDGMGLLEFLEWCEDLHMEPVLAVYAGYSHKEDETANSTVRPGAELAPFVQDALDEIEYVTGSARTIWGRRRAADGHALPFKLSYVEVGNEDWNPKPDYDGRFAQFFDAIKAKYPALQVIATTEVKSRKPDVLDEHHYRKAQDFFGDVHHYDVYPRSGPKIFVGEWATVESWGMPGEHSTPNLRAALGDAAWMTGIERNSDLVIMHAYAPLFVNVNGHKWPQFLIGFDALDSYGTPSYYAQVLFNTYRGNEVLASSPGVVEELCTSVTRESETGTIYVKAVNASAGHQTVRIEIIGTTKLASQRKVIELSGKPEDTNSIDHPNTVSPVERVLMPAGAKFTHTFPP